jgi:hypothetical protein
LLIEQVSRDAIDGVRLLRCIRCLGADSVVFALMLRHFDFNAAPRSNRKQCFDLRLLRMAALT